jgi:hemerythrin-like metal-binding protein
MLSLNFPAIQPMNQYWLADASKVWPLFSFSWKRNYSLGIIGLDKQHQAIMDSLNQLHEVMMSGRVNEDAAPLIDRLVSLAQEHFATEERLMEATQFPGLADHRAKHQALSLKVREFIARHEMGDKAAYSQFMYFLRGWMTRHMQKEDHECAPWLAAHGIR